MSDAFEKLGQSLEKMGESPDFTPSINGSLSMSGDNFIVGVILAGKAITQSFFNFFIGSITARFGYQIPMFIGFMLTIGSTILFAFSKTAAMMLIARGIQGIGTSFRYL
jgi:MFS family permease